MKGGRRIFLIEDDVDLRESLRDLLILEGYIVGDATDGLDAIIKLREMNDLPGLIILDWMMPKMDGAQFCAEKRKYSEIDKVPVMLLTADGRLAEKVKQVGAAQGIAKPVDIDVLLAEVDKYFN